MHPAPVRTGWQPGSRIEGDWHLRALLGRGATSEVWEADGPAGPVALKALHPELASRPGMAEALRREARKGRSLHHPSLVRVLGEGEAEGRPFIVMELLRGAPLRNAWPPPLSRARVAALLAGPAGALARLHAAGLVHGDVTPGNLFVEESGTVRLLDLGAARMAAGSALDESGWAPPHGLPLATPRWAAPERLRGDPPDPRDDIHSLAKVAVALLAGPPTRMLRAALGPRETRPSCARQLIASLRPWGLLRAGRLLMDEMTGRAAPSDVMWEACHV